MVSGSLIIMQSVDEDGQGRARQGDDSPPPPPPEASGKQGGVDASVIQTVSRSCSSCSVCG